MTEMVANETSTDPFCELELGSLMGDEDRTQQAMLDAARTFGNIEIGSKWKQREEAIWSKRAALFGVAPRAPIKASRNEVLFQDLVNDPDNEAWINIWLQLWGSKYRLEELTKVALWWMDIGHAEDEVTGAIIDTLLRKGRDTSVDNHAQNWLGTHTILSRWWSGIWLTLRNVKGHGNEAIRELALDNLRRFSSTGQAMSRAWAFLWMWTWRSHPGRADLIEVAEVAANEATPYSVTTTFIENVAQPVIFSGYRSATITDIAISWLVNYPKSTLLWANLYLRVNALATDINRQTLEDIAIFWLRTSGGNINKWYDVLDTIKSNLSADMKFDICYKWLLRSRWDLSSWPKVFREAAMLATDNQIDYLKSLADRWFSYAGGSNKSIAGMRQAAQYLAGK